MRVHFIAVGGAVMHNLALELKRKGYEVSGSDDEIFEPSRSRLAVAGILPDKEGWYPEKISHDIDTVILGMHARADNPELITAREMGLTIKSFPEYFYEQTSEKTRIVIGGSHGKTTTTAMIMHVLKSCGISFDYLVGSAIEGYETMVRFNKDSKIAVIEGDEYLTSPSDRRPKFHLYQPHIAIINGIAWDHMNVFPTFGLYCKQFEVFAATIMPGGTLIYFRNDPEVVKIAEKSRDDIKKVPFDVHGYFINKTGCYAATVSRTVRVNFIGAHNMQNLSAAREACLTAGVSEKSFYDAIATFKGTERRLQLLSEGGGRTVYYDFAHAPSKVMATVNAVAERYPSKRIVAVLELHTYSSLSSGFLPQYSGSMKNATEAYVFYNPHALTLKKLPNITKEEVAKAFDDNNIRVFNDFPELSESLYSSDGKDIVFLFMSSGDFNGTNMQLMAEKLVNKR